MSNDLERSLSMFTGTEVCHRWSILFMFVCTDGVKYLAEKAGAYWLLDAIASYQFQKKFVRESFQTWKFKKNEDGEGGILTAEDGNGRVLATQEIEYTDFPLDTIKLYFIDGVILLPSEY